MSGHEVVGLLIATGVLMWMLGFLTGHMAGWVKRDVQARREARARAHRIHHLTQNSPR